MRYDEYPAYISVGERRAKAEKKLRQLQKNHPYLTPVILAGQTLARTWWGKSWNHNLERYADYSNRIGRGRSYVRHRCVLDLQLTPGNITAMVQGSSPQPYDVVITVDTLRDGNWAAIRKACAGGFDSLSELLAGQFPQAFKDLFFAKGSGLFPAPQDIHFDCSCPDWASMCKHVAATLYGVGARLDDDPSLFFTLRGINISDIITQTVTDTAQTLLRKAEHQSHHRLHDVDLGDVFGIQLDVIEASLPDVPPVKTKAATTQKKTTRAPKTSAAQKSTRAGTPLATQRHRLHQQNASVAGKAVNSPATTSKTLKKRATAAPPHLQHGTMLDALVKAVGKGRQGQSVDQLQAKLGWTTTQVRNAVHRAGVKGLIDMINPGVYRQKV
jgi:uncharacterized Zn finger protein